jgi:hypothetical protein
VCKHKFSAKHASKYLHALDLHPTIVVFMHLSPSPLIISLSNDTSVADLVTLLLTA